MLNYQAHLQKQAPYSYDRQQQQSYTLPEVQWPTLVRTWAYTSLAIYIPIALDFFNAGDLLPISIGLLFIGWLWHHVPFGDERSLVRCLPLFVASVWFVDAIASFVIPVWIQATLAIAVLIFWGTQSNGQEESAA